MRGGNPKSLSKERLQQGGPGRAAQGSRHPDAAPSQQHFAQQVGCVLGARARWGAPGGDCE